VVLKMLGSCPSRRQVREAAREVADEAEGGEGEVSVDVAVRKNQTR